ncbi:helix-turn-helix domain-containing protein [Catenulispora sp. NF23]|uniref:helix-turn-helix domain-containing protein n=1 Tax=Catenulispora pinistramenti TaxID=2705254 RepID=UPI001BA468A0|nr:helix-turn-helix transcriptional regulator [Catenulispora pinistramenti]MBS2539296.1 helix-turn-helix domain-containing protein [Catenulispora pinistramenti]
MAADNLLGDFLKARRARIAPSGRELALSGQRRVAGLRRDELARQAGISEPYLTRLEQGVDRHPSPQVLQALARALELDADTAAYFYSLAAPAPDAAPGPARSAGRAASGPGAGGLEVAGPEVSEDVHRLLDAWADSPAYVRDRRFDVLAANKAARALASMYEPGRNLAREVFFSPGARRLLPDWPLIAEQTVAALRAEADQRDPQTVRLIAELETSEDFRRLWAKHDARPSRDELKRFAHPDVGELSLRRQALTVGGAEQLVIIVYQAAPGSASADALARLVYEF